MLHTIDHRIATTRARANQLVMQSNDAQLRERLDFIKKHRDTDISQDTAHRLLTTLISSNEYIFDLQGDSARLLAVFLDQLENANDACEMVLLSASGSWQALQPLLLSAFDQMETLTVTATPRQALLVETGGIFSAANAMLAKRGYRVIAESLIFECLCSSVLSAPAEYTWIAVDTDDRVEQYWHLTRSAFADLSGVSFPDYSGFRSGVLSSRIPPELLFNNGEAIAFVKLAVCDNAAEATLDLLGRAPHYQGKRLGDQAIMHACTLAQKHGATRIVVDVDASNTSALTLYKRHRFTERAKQKSWLKRLPR